MNDVLPSRPYMPPSQHQHRPGSLPHAFNSTVMFGPVPHPQPPFPFGGFMDGMPPPPPPPLPPMGPPFGGAGYSDLFFKQMARANGPTALKTQTPPTWAPAPTSPAVSKPRSPPTQPQAPIASLTKPTPHILMSGNGLPEDPALLQVLTPSTAMKFDARTEDPSTIRVPSQKPPLNTNGPSRPIAAAVPAQPSGPQVMMSRLVPGVKLEDSSPTALKPVILSDHEDRAVSFLRSSMGASNLNGGHRGGGGVQVVNQSQQPRSAAQLSDPPCDHSRDWKCLRVKLGVRHMLCLSCKARWRMKRPLEDFIKPTPALAPGATPSSLLEQQLLQHSVYPEPSAVDITSDPLALLENHGSNDPPNQPQSDDLLHISAELASLLNTPAPGDSTPGTPKAGVFSTTNFNNSNKGLFSVDSLLPSFIDQPFLDLIGIPGEENLK